MKRIILIVILWVLLSSCGGGPFPYADDDGAGDRMDAMEAEADKAIVDDYYNQGSLEPTINWSTSDAWLAQTKQYEKTQEAYPKKNKSFYESGSCVIKGNISFEGGEKIYHLPGQKYYNQTKINPVYGERWFCSEEEARDAGWRKSWE